MRLSIGIGMCVNVLLDFAIVTKHDRLDDAAYELVGPHAKQNALGSAACLGPWIAAAVEGGSQHIVHTVRIEDERWIGYVVFASGLRQ